MSRKGSKNRWLFPISLSLSLSDRLCDSRAIGCDSLAANEVHDRYTTITASILDGFFLRLLAMAGDGWRLLSANTEDDDQVAIINGRLRHESICKWGRWWCYDANTWPVSLMNRAKDSEVDLASSTVHLWADEWKRKWPPFFICHPFTFCLGRVCYSSIASCYWAESGDAGMGIRNFLLLRWYFQWQRTLASNK